LTLYFVAVHESGPRIFKASRPDTTSAFSAPQPILSLGQSDGDYTPAISPDDQSLYYARRDANPAVYVARRGNDGKFLPGQPVAGINSMHNDQSLWISTDGLWAVFSSDRSDGLTSTLWTASRSSPDDGFSEATPLEAEGAFALSPSCDQSGTTLFFSTSRDHESAAGNIDIWMATREDPSQRFGPAAPLANVNSEGYEAAPWLSSDGTTLYFYSNRADVMSSDAQLYSATRSCTTM
jgi:Tol biopolymer transport system component